MRKKRYKKLDGGLSSEHLKRSEDEGYTGNLLLSAMHDPDLMSDEQTIFHQRDYDAEQERKQYLIYFRHSLRSLTERQKQIVKAVNDYPTQEEAAKLLGIKRSTLSMHLQIIQKKIKKHIGKLQAREQ